MKENKILLYPHGGSGNRGCEAIVRSTAKILNDYTFELFSTRTYEDCEAGLDSLCKVSPINREVSYKMKGFLTSVIKHKLKIDREAIDKLHFSPVPDSSKTAKAVLSIGGDNYCYDVPKHLYLINREVRRTKTKNILWGCSINPEAIDREMLDDLYGFDYIFTRESLTYEALKNKNLKNVILYPDPAFVLSREKAELPSGFQKNNTVGINVSPMILSYEKQSGLTLKCYIRLINHILENTTMSVALIPHVIWDHNDDRIPLEKLYENFKGNDRIVMIPGYGAEKIKDVIAQCRFIITARTHASIAAYSECIPTLVVGYSIKAKGIATDLFGEWKRLVIPVQDLKNEDSLVDSFSYILNSETEIRNHLKEIMPEYKRRAFEAGQKLTELCNA